MAKSKCDVSPSRCFNTSMETSDGTIAKFLPFAELLWEGGGHEGALKSPVMGFKAQQWALAGDGYHLHPLPLPPRHTG